MEMNTEMANAQTLECTEVWGGNGREARSVELPGMTAWVYSNPLEGAEAGGDLHYLSVCDQGVLSRVALADVSGHGRAVVSGAQRLHGLMREYIQVWDQSEFLRELNLAFHQESSTRYATAVLLGYYRTKGQLVLTNAGHVPPLWYHQSERSWGWLEESPSPMPGRFAGLPVGLMRGTNYRQTVFTLKSADVLVLFTDGITESRNESGVELGRDQLMEWARAVPVHSAEATGRAFLDRLSHYRRRPPNDDETLVVLRRWEG